MDKYIQKLSQFVTTLITRKDCSIDLITKSIKISDFLSILYSKPLREYRKPKFKNGDRVCISKCDLPFRKSHRQQFTQENLDNVAISSRKPPTYTKKDEQDEIIRGREGEREKVDQSQLTMESFTKELVSNASAQLIRGNTLSSFTNLLPEELNLEGQGEVAISTHRIGDILPINVPQCHGGQIYVF